MKAGKLDKFREEALADVRAGKFKHLQDLRNFDHRTLCERENPKKTQMFSWHPLTGYATKERDA